MQINVDGSGILDSNLVTFGFSLFYLVLSATSLSIASLNFVKSTETAFSSTISESSALFFKLFKPLGTCTSLPISNCLTSTFKAIKSVLGAKLKTSTPAACLNSFFLV